MVANGARLGDGLKAARGFAAELGLKVARLNFDLRDSVERDEGVHAADVGVLHRDAVNRDAVLRHAAAVHVVLAGLAEALRLGAAAVVDHAGLERAEHGKVAADDGEVLHLLAGHDAGALAAGGLHGGAFGGHGDGLGGHAEGEINLADGEPAVGFERDIRLLVFAEAGVLDLDAVGAGEHRSEGEVAVVVARHLARDAGLFRDQAHVRAGDRRALRIGDGADDGASLRLSQSERAQQEYAEQSDDFQDPRLRNQRHGSPPLSSMLHPPPCRLHARPLLL